MDSLAVLGYFVRNGQLLWFFCIATEVTHDQELVGIDHGAWDCMEWKLCVKHI